MSDVIPLDPAAPPTAPAPDTPSVAALYGIEGKLKDLRQMGELGMLAIDACGTDEPNSIELCLFVLTDMAEKAADVWRLHQSFFPGNGEAMKRATEGKARALRGLM
jgi:hypothetical protein